MSHYLILGIFALTGLLALLASLCNWDWFFTARNAQFAVNSFGRRGARWCYGTVGLLLIAMACYFATQVPQA